MLEGAPSSLRGEITRWLIEIKAGVFIGTLSSRVRDLLWEKIRESAVKSVFMAYRANNEQGFVIQGYGDSQKEIRDFNGLQLLFVRNS